MKKANELMVKTAVSVQTNAKKYRSIFSGMLIALYVMMFIALPVLAADGDLTGDITTGINSGLKNVFSIIKAIILPVGVIALGVCGVKIIWGNQKSAEEGKSAMIRIVIALAIVYLAPLLIEQIASWFRNTGEGHEATIFGS